MMGHLLAVKEKQVATDNLFEPLHETIELLKSYGQELPDEVYQQLQVRLVTEFCKRRVIRLSGVGCLGANKSLI